MLMIIIVITILSSIIMMYYDDFIHNAYKTRTYKPTETT